MNNIWHELEKIAKGLTFKDSGDKRKWMDTKFKENMTEVGRSLVDDMNCMGCENEAVEGLTNGITNTHRELQNDFWIAMVKVIKKYGDTNPNHYDDRNEWAVAVCKRMAEVADLTPQEWQKIKDISKINIR